MISDWTALIEDVGNRLYEVFLLPVTWLMSLLASHAPGLFDNLGPASVDEGRVWPFILASLIWLLLVFAVLKVVSLIRNGIRIAEAWIRLVQFRISMSIRGLKTKLVCKFRQLLPHRRTSGISVIPDIDMDEIDMAVLRSMSSRGPGFAMSAPDLAEEFRLRPTQVQRRLDKLRKSNMLEDVIGTTDGYDNYRLTTSGFTLLAMWNRQTPAT